MIKEEKMQILEAHLNIQTPLLRTPVSHRGFKEELHFKEILIFNITRAHDLKSYLLMGEGMKLFH